MVIDSSALVAILLKEPGFEELLDAVDASDATFLSAATLVEASVVLEARKGREGARDLDLFIFRSGTEVVPVDNEQVDAARAAWRRFGRGNHPAKLNFGDLFAYALASATGLPLLFKGDDFALMDITPALAP
jgi:ribonuclease VapC